MRRWGGRARRAAQSGIAAARLRVARRRVLVRDDGDGGPLLVVVPDRGGFGRFLVEILRAEGVSGFSVVPLSGMSEEALAAHDVVLLAEVALSEVEAVRLERWVHAGGGLVTMRPDPRLAPLAGVRILPGGVEEGYLLVEPSGVGEGITGRAMQFHGPADRYELDGSDAVADLLDADRSATGGPAVSVRWGDGTRGVVAAFAYDLARSVVYTRQGNPAWAGQNRDGDLVVRSNDLFFGASPTDPRPDWVDPELLDIPQADEQQRLLVNLLHAASGERPLALLWYLPRGVRAAVVMTGDDHGGNGTPTRFAELATLDPDDGGSNAWGCVRATSYVVPESPLSASTAAELSRQGFEISLHATVHDDRFTAGSLSRDLGRQLRAFRTAFPGVPAPVTHRTHCVPWSDWSTQAEVERAHGIRLDTNYYYFPTPWVRDRPAHFTGSALPMRFARMSGEVIDCYQLVTQLTDESGQSFPDTVDSLLDRSLEPDGHVAVLTANMHTDLHGSNGSDAIVASALARGVPVVSARQMLTWLDARAGSSFASTARSDDGVHGVLRVHPDADGLVAMLPLDSTQGDVTAVSVAGRPVDFWQQRHAGRRYVGFLAASGAVDVELAPESRARLVDPSAGAQPTAEGEASVAGGPGSPLSPIVHSQLADFVGGQLEGTSLSRLHGGSILLRPHLSLEPDADHLGATGIGWQAHHDEGGSVSVTDGVLRLAGASITAEEPVEPGCTLETAAVFASAPGQQLALVGDGGAVVGFRTEAGGALHAIAGRGADIHSQLLQGAWLDEPHRFKVLWQPGLVIFLVDGWPLAQHRIAIGGPLRPCLASAGPDAPLQIHAARVSPFTAAGSYTSTVIDGGREVWWGRATVTAVAQSMSAVRIAVRTGPTPTPDDGWSPFVEPAPAGRPVAQRGRYAQYRLDLSTRWHVTAEVRKVRLERRLPG